MILKYLFSLSLVALFTIPAMLAIQLFEPIVQVPTATLWLLIAIASLILIVNPSPAAFRDFWQRLIARIQYSVPITA